MRGRGTSPARNSTQGGEASAPLIESGDLVLRRRHFGCPQRSENLLPGYCGPFKISRQLGPVTYTASKNSPGFDDEEDAEFSLLIAVGLNFMGRVMST